MSSISTMRSPKRSSSVGCLASNSTSAMLTWGDAYVDGLTRYEWYKQRTGRGVWPSEREQFRPLDTSRLHARHLREQPGAHLLRITHKGEIILTRFGRDFLDMLATRRDHG